MTPKEKLDKALGISSEGSIDEFLSDLDVQKESSQNALVQVDTAIKETLSNVDSSLEDLKKSNRTNQVDLTGEIQKSLNDINELVGLSKQIIQHLYNDIVSSELVDSELIASTASFIQATHENIKEYIELYRDRLKFFDTVKLEMIRHQNRKDEIQLKHELAIQRINAENPLNKTPENMKVFNQEDIVGALKNMTV